MEFHEYQKKSRKTAIYPNIGKNYVYPLLGLAGETGEIFEKFKKLIRDNGGVMSREFKEAITLELGDILWYLSNLCSELKISLDEVAKKNLEKLLSRKERGKLRGSGDNR
ncbi:MAG: nucleoside triphosphate pyrophosphohydrolase family protein [Deltaproteobacteria bacterium]|nr:nucleoside triphosphate pyrophosphohydrolase family protein [Deltaproteobacteria bacterium]MCX7952007.1 nucleoside triphosphate pyrophosphohydrolase family protein [Deltaproteobacteria bacterium]